MRYFLTILAVLALCSAGISYAKVPQELVVYAKPSLKSQVLARTVVWEVWQKMAPFHRRGPWVKVGFRRSGQVGWINMQQYNKLLQAMYKPQVKSLYIRSKSVNGKTSVVAYEDGKMLSQKQAWQLLQQSQQQQQLMAQRMLQMQRHMDQMLHNMMRMPLSWPQPIIVIDQTNS